VSVRPQLLLVLFLALVGSSLPPLAHGQLVTREVTGPAARPIVFHHAARDSTVATALAELAVTFVPQPLVADGLPPDTLHVIVAPTEGAFVELTGGRAPDWGLAVAFPKLRRVIIRSPRLTSGGGGADPATILRHELGHLYLDLASGGSERVPRWFNEGFSAFYADEWRWVDPARLAWGRLTGSLVPLAELDATFPELPAPRLSYIQSMAAVRSLRRRGGDDSVRLLLDRVRDGATFDAALRATYGLTLGQFYADWNSELGREFGWGVALTDERALWIAAALLVLGGYLIRRRALRREIARRRHAEDIALGPPEDHSLGVERWERYWEDDDEEWKGDPD
jgi:hypothetical protein